MVNSVSKKQVSVKQEENGQFKTELESTVSANDGSDQECICSVKPGPQDNFENALNPQTQAFENNQYSMAKLFAAPPAGNGEKNNLQTTAVDSATIEKATAKLLTQHLEKKDIPASAKEKLEIILAKTDENIVPELMKLQETLLLADGFAKLPDYLKISDAGKHLEEKIDTAIIEGTDEATEEAQYGLNVLQKYLDYEENIRLPIQGFILAEFPPYIEAKYINFAFDKIAYGLIDADEFNKLPICQVFQELPKEQKLKMSHLLTELRRDGFWVFADDNTNFEMIDQHIDKQIAKFEKANFVEFFDKINSHKAIEKKVDTAINGENATIELAIDIERLGIIEFLLNPPLKLSPEQDLAAKASVLEMLKHEKKLIEQNAEKEETTSVGEKKSGQSFDILSLLEGTATAVEKSAIQMPEGKTSNPLTEIMGKYKNPSAKYAELESKLVEAAIKSVEDGLPLDPAILKLLSGMIKSRVVSDLKIMAESESPVTVIDAKTISFEADIKAVEEAETAEELSIAAKSLMEKIDEVALFESLNEHIKGIDEQIDFVDSMVGIHFSVKAGNKIHLKNLKKNYEKAKDLLLKGDVSGARTEFLKYSQSAFAKQVNADYLNNLSESEKLKSKVRIGIIVASGFFASWAAMVTSPLLAGAGLSAGNLSLGGLLIEGGVFMGSEKMLNYFLLGELPINPKKGIGENVGHLAFEYASTVLMFKFLKMSGQKYESVAQNFLFKRAETSLVKNGLIKEGEYLTSNTAKELILKEMELGIVGKLFYKSGALASEYAGFTAWDVIQTTASWAIMKEKADIEALLSPDAMKERALFLFGLKVGGLLANPITSTAMKKTSQIMAVKYKPEIDALKKETSKVLKKFIEYNESDSKNVNKLSEIIGEMKPLLKKRSALEASLVKAGVVSPEQAAVTEAMNKYSKQLDKELSLLTNITKGLTQKSNGIWKYNPANKTDLIQMLSEVEKKSPGSITLGEAGVIEITLFDGKILILQPFIKESSSNVAQKEATAPVGKSYLEGSEAKEYWPQQNVDPVLLKLFQKNVPSFLIKAYIGAKNVYEKAQKLATKIPAFADIAHNIGAHPAEASVIAATLASASLFLGKTSASSAAIKMAGIFSLFFGKAPKEKAPQEEGPLSKTPMPPPVKVVEMPNLQLNNGGEIVFGRGSYGLTQLTTSSKHIKIKSVNGKFILTNIGANPVKINDFFVAPKEKVKLTSGIYEIDFFKEKIYIKISKATVQTESAKEAKAETNEAVKYSEDQILATLKDFESIGSIPNEGENAGLRGAVTEYIKTLNEKVPEKIDSNAVINLTNLNFEDITNFGVDRSTFNRAKDNIEKLGNLFYPGISLLKSAIKLEALAKNFAAAKTPEKLIGMIKACKTPFAERLANLIDDILIFKSSANVISSIKKLGHKNDLGLQNKVKELIAKKLKPYTEGVEDIDTLITNLENSKDPNINKLAEIVYDLKTEVESRSFNEIPEPIIKVFEKKIFAAEKEIENFSELCKLYNEKYKNKIATFKDHGDVQFRYHMAVKLLKYSALIEGAKDFSELIFIVEKLPFKEIPNGSASDNIHKSLLMELLEKVSEGSGKVNELPNTLGIKAKAQELSQAVYTSKTEPISFEPSDIKIKYDELAEGLQKEIIDLINFDVKKYGFVKGNQKNYTPEEIKGLVKAIIDGKKYPDFAPNKFRDKIESFMMEVVESAIKDFPLEFGDALKNGVNPFDGNPISNKNAFAKYVLATQLIRKKCGLPVFQPVSAEQIKETLGLADKYFTDQFKSGKPADYEGSRNAIKKALFDPASTAAKKFWENSTPDERRIAVETIFGYFTHIELDVNKTSLKDAKYFIEQLAKYGCYREVGLFASIEGKKVVYKLSLGNMESVQGDNGLIFHIAHSHPQIFKKSYSNPSANISATVALDKTEMIENVERILINVFPSASGVLPYVKGDLGALIKQADKYKSNGYMINKSENEFYFGENFYSLVFSPYGISLTKYDPKAAKMTIYYAFHPDKKETIKGYKGYDDVLKDANEYETKFGFNNNIKIDIIETSMEELKMLHPNYFK